MVANGNKETIQRARHFLFSTRRGRHKADVSNLVVNYSENLMAKKAKRRVKRVAWTKPQLAELRKYSKDKLPVEKISRLMKRTPGALRQKARSLRIRLGHRR